jgi:hypothetical protein
MSSLKNKYRSVVKPVGVTVVRNLTDDGTGITGSKDVTGDYSATPKDFWVQPPGDQLWIIREVGGTVNGINNASLDDYGAIVDGLTNGLKFFLEIDGQEINITASSNHKNNADLLSNGNRGYMLDYGGNSKLDQFYLPALLDTDTITLDGNRNMKFILRANDDFTTLEAHTFYLHADNKGPLAIG